VEGSRPFDCPATSFWLENPSIIGDEHGRHINVSPRFQNVPEPDLEELECGHEQKIRVWGGRKYYNRRRRCDSCARGLEPVMPCSDSTSNALGSRS